MKKIGKKLCVLMFVALMLCFSQPTYAATQTDLIRIGLETNFLQQSSMTITDTKVGIGYSVNNSYTSLATLSSTKGFVFTPTTKYYGKSTTNYTSYSKAKSMANQLKTSYGVTSYVGIFDKGTIRVVIEASSASALTTAMNKVKSTLAFESIGGNNGHRVEMVGSSDTILYDGSGTNAYPQLTPVTKNQAGDEVLTIKTTSTTKSYRGRLEIGRYNQTGITAVNVVPIDNYLYGVVPAEMVSSWHTEALKAQAVVARTYARNKGKELKGDSDSTSPYKLNDTTSSQVYKGYLGEVASTNAAVDATKGEYIYYNNALIDATFFSTSGGATANSSDVWVGDVSYLKGVSDIYETEPEKKPWIFTFTTDTIKEKLSAKGDNIGTIQSLTEGDRTSSGRLAALTIKGSSGSVTLEKEKIRSYFGTYSTKFKVIEYGDTPDKVTVLGANGQKKSKRIQSSYILSASGTVKGSATDNEQYVVMGSRNMSNYPKNAPTSKGTYYFAGMGYGHGVGMSQSGANGMAKAGYTYKEIIKHYYTNVEIKE